MRKNMRLVLQAFTDHKSKQGKTCRTDGNTIYSYSLPIARYDGEGYVLIREADSTRTTNSHIRACVEWFAPASVKRVPSL